MNKPDMPVVTVHSYDPEDFEDKCQALNTLGYKLISSSCHPDPDRELQWAAVFARPGISPLDSVAPSDELTILPKRQCTCSDYKNGQLVLVHNCPKHGW